MFNVCRIYFDFLEVNLIYDNKSNTSNYFWKYVHNTFVIHTKKNICNICNTHNANTKSIEILLIGSTLVSCERGIPQCLENKCEFQAGWPWAGMTSPAASGRRTSQPRRCTLKNMTLDGGGDIFYPTSTYLQGESKLIGPKWTFSKTYIVR